MSEFAKGTQVSAEKSRAEIERILERYGATGFFYAAESGRVAIGFRAHERFVRFTLPLPMIEAFKRRPGSYRERSKSEQQAAYDQAIRQKWRCLVLAIKAKLEVVQSGIASFEDEFLANIMTPDGQTVGDHVRPRIEEAYRTGASMPLLPPG